MRVWGLPEGQVGPFAVDDGRRGSFGAGIILGSRRRETREVGGEVAIAPLTDPAAIKIRLEA